MVCSDRDRTVPPRSGGACGRPAASRLRRAAVCALLLWGTSAAAQVRPTNEVSRCTLITDPTAQRACIEGAVNARPAPSFDPTVRPPRAPAPVASPVLSPVPARDKARPKGPAPANVDTAQGAPKADKADGGEYRDTRWRLQIP